MHSGSTVGRRAGVLSVALVGLLLVGAGSARAETLFVVSGEMPPVLGSLDSATPGTVTVLGQVTGLQAGEQLWGIATRPAPGQLYAVGTTDRVYVLDPAT